MELTKRRRRTQAEAWGSRIAVTVVNGRPRVCLPDDLRVRRPMFEKVQLARPIKGGTKLMRRTEG